MILSWDIGMYNLSYCLLCKHDCSSNNIKISSNNIDTSSNIVARIINGIDNSLNNIYKFEDYCIKDWGIINIADKFNLKKNKMGVYSNIHDILDEYPHFLECEHVIIENQLGLRNGTMKSIQMILYTYFLIKGLKNNYSNIHNIEFRHASNKLKVYDGPEFTLKIKSKSTQRKRSAVIHSKYFLKNNNILLSFFNSTKKNDDLADAFLQGLYHIKYIINGYKPTKKKRIIKPKI